jgi:predicted MPP superfamily phosphohydrolase
MKKQKKPPRLRRLVITGIFIIIALFMTASLIAGFVVSRMTHVDRVTLMLRDLPEEFEGTTVLYVSDVDMVGLSSPGGTAALFRKLERLKPDMLILGGDYASPSLMDRINGSVDQAALAEKRRRLFASLNSFDAPLGKFAVAGDNDPADTLADELAAGGILLLSDSTARIQSGDARLIVAGLSDYSHGRTDYPALAAGCAAGDCVIAVAHNPASITGMLTAEAGDTGSWCDVALSGHTHGGQAILGGRSMLKLTDRETRYGTGWSKESSVFVLVSEGLGCEAINLRLGTSSSVHLITLKRAVPVLTFPE